MTSRAKLKSVAAGSVLAVTLGLAMVAERQRQPAPAPPQEERAVFGDVTPAPAPAPQRPSPVVPGESPTTERARRATSEAIPAGINALLDRWRTSILDTDLERHVACYAPKLDRFFTQRNVSLGAVRREKQRMFDLYPKFETYRLSDVVLEQSDDRTATVSFRKEWDARGRRRFAGAERQRLKLERFGDEWKIVSEEELKVYWVKRA